MHVIYDGDLLKQLNRTCNQSVRKQIYQQIIRLTDYFHFSSYWYCFKYSQNKTNKNAAVIFILEEKESDIIHAQTYPVPVTVKVFDHKI